MDERRIKIGFFNSYYPEIAGGSEYQTYLLAKSLGRELFDPFFISLSTRRHGYQEINGDRVYFFQPKGCLSKIDKGYLSNIAFVQRALAKEKPDVIYQRMANSATGILALLAKIQGFKFLWACASQEDISPLRFRVANPGTWISNALRTYGIRNATSIILQSNDQRKDLLARFRLDGTVLKNGHPLPEGECSVYSFPLKVVFVGNFKTIKRPEIFMELARRFTGRPSVEFLMAGRVTDALYRNHVTGLAESGNITWLGELTQDDVNHLLDQAYVLVNTSEYEGFSNTFVQAWLRGVPVLSLTVDPDSLLSTGGMGLLAGNFETLCNQLQHLLENPEVRNAMGTRGRQYAVSEHSADVIAGSFKNIVTGVVDG